MFGPSACDGVTIAAASYEGSLPAVPGPMVGPGSRTQALRSTRHPQGLLPCPCGNAHFCCGAFELTGFICCPQQISECGMLSGQGQGFS
jgi:hypothetical protein